MYIMMNSISTHKQMAIDYELDNREPFTGDAKQGQWDDPTSWTH